MSVLCLVSRLEGDAARWAAVEMDGWVRTYPEQASATRVTALLSAFSHPHVSISRPCPVRRGRICWSRIMVSVGYAVGSGDGTNVIGGPPWRCQLSSSPRCPFGRGMTQAATGRYVSSAQRMLRGLFLVLLRTASLGCCHYSRSHELTPFPIVHNPGENMRVAYRRSDGGWEFHASDLNLPGASVDLQREPTMALSTRSHTKEKKLNPGELTTRGYVEHDVEGNPPPAYHHHEGSLFSESTGAGV